MTFPIFNFRVLVIALFMMASSQLHAQQPMQMHILISQSLSKLQQPTPEALLNCIAELKRIEAIFPDSLQPKILVAKQILNYAVMNPHSPQTVNLLTEAEKTISKMEQQNPVIQKADLHTADNYLSDVCTLRGFLYMVRIVQNPSENGQRYYIDVMQNYEKALKLNPDNQLAAQLQEKFLEGMKQQTRK